MRLKLILEKLRFKILMDWTQGRCHWQVFFEDAK
jgi:hypothetical protein